MKNLNTSTYYLFNISLLLEQYLHIQKQVTEHLQDLHHLNELTQYQDKVNNKDLNLEFIENCNSSINDVFSYKNEIIPEVIQNISNYVKNNCNHEWVNDDIDLHLDKTLHIYYCNYCGISKNH
jgi:GTPase SAR1 family protein